METFTRQQALATLTEGQAALEALLSRLAESELSRPATIGGGDWSARDLLGHVAFWEEQALEALTAWQAGQRPAIEAVGAAGQAGVDAANARNQEVTARQSVAAVRARASAAHSGLIQAIEALSDAEWRAPPTYEQARWRSLGECLGSVLGGEPDQPFGHLGDHLPDLQAYLTTLGR
jgi:hypothetical protein